MKIIIGLGNPGKEYENTRHNVGFMTLDRMVEGMENGEWRMEKKFNAEIFRGDNVLLVKPQGYMNKSGEVVRKIILNSQFSILNLYVVHDDLDIKLGEYKIQLGKGPKVHNGVKSIEQQLKTKDFWRVRIGIENRFQKTQKLQISKTPNKLKLQNDKKIKRLDISGEEYVLGRFVWEEKLIIDKVIDEVAAAIVERL